jgi:hypothetical protein
VRSRRAAPARSAITLDRCADWRHIAHLGLAQHLPEGVMASDRASRACRAHPGSRRLVGNGSFTGAALLALFLALPGCAADPTPYQPVANGYGFSDQQIEGNRYRITFAGNSATSIDTVRNYMLYRAAEVTVESGHDYFVVVDQNTQSSTVYRGTGSTPFGFGTGFRGDGGFGVGFSTFSAYPDDSYTSWADIVVGNGSKPADNVNAYDAHDVLRRLDPAVVRAPGVMRVVPPPQQQPPPQPQQ